jgi:predicted alpha/beta hydrolase family esterase
MKKNAIIFHGTGDKPTDFWFPWLKKNLEDRGYVVWLPELPNAETPNLEDWLTFVLKNGIFSKDTVLVGHSAGAQLILNILQKIDMKVKRVILVSGYAESLRVSSQSDEKPLLNWPNIRSHAEQFVFINSDNDPWGCDDKQGKIMREKLGGELIVLHEGHMGSTTYNQPYKEFPLLLDLI